MLSKFHANIITGSKVLKIFVHEEFDQKFGNWKYSRLSFVQLVGMSLLESYLILQNARFTALIF